MLKFKSMSCLALAVAISTGLLLLVWENSWAALVDVDLFTPGDKKLTRDSATGLDWLDLTESTNLSVNDIQGGAGGYVDMGFRYATIEELHGLRNAAGSSTSDITLTLVNHLGCTRTCNPPYGFGEGFLYFHHSEEPYRLATYGYFNLGEGDYGGFIDDETGWQPSDAATYVGSLLVRPVPIPSSFIMFGGGIAGLASIMAWRKSKRIQCN